MRTCMACYLYGMSFVPKLPAKSVIEPATPQAHSMKRRLGLSSHFSVDAILLLSMSTLSIGAIDLIFDLVIICRCG